MRAIIVRRHANRLFPLLDGGPQTGLTAPQARVCLQTPQRIGVATGSRPVGSKPPIVIFDHLAGVVAAVGDAADGAHHVAPRGGHRPCPAPVARTAFYSENPANSLIAIPCDEVVGTILPKCATMCRRTCARACQDVQKASRIASRLFARHRHRSLARTKLSHIHFD
jgi:hypothetical protein